MLPSALKVCTKSTPMVGDAAPWLAAMTKAALDVKATVEPKAVVVKPSVSIIAAWLKLTLARLTPTEIPSCPVVAERLLIVKWLHCHRHRGEQ